MKIFDFRNVGSNYRVSAESLDEACDKLFATGNYPVHRETRAGVPGWCADLPGGNGECVWHPSEADTTRYRDSECARRMACLKSQCSVDSGRDGIEYVYLNDMR